MDKPLEAIRQEIRALTFALLEMEPDLVPEYAAVLQQERIQAQQRADKLAGQTR